MLLAGVRGCALIVSKTSFDRRNAISCTCDSSSLAIGQRVDTDAAAAADAANQESEEEEMTIAGMKLDDLPPEHLCSIVSVIHISSPVQPSISSPPFLVYSPVRSAFPLSLFSHHVLLTPAPPLGVSMCTNSLTLCPPPSARTPNHLCTVPCIPCLFLTLRFPDLRIPSVTPSSPRTPDGDLWQARCCAVSLLLAAARAP